MGRRRGRWFAGALVLVAVLGWTAHATSEVGAAADDAVALRDRLQVAIDTDAPLTILDDATRSELEAIATGLHDLDERLDAGSLRPIRWLPVVGRQLDAADHQVDAAAVTLDVTVDLIDAADRAEAALTDPGRRVEALRQLGDDVRRGADRLRTIDLGPDEALVGPLTEGRAELVEQLDAATELLDEGVRTIDAAVELAAGPSSYLVLAANNAQMQNGSGMFLSAARLDLVDGEVRLGTMTSMTDLELPAEPVDLPPFLDERWGWLDPNRDWRHLGLSPRFPETAELAADLWEATTGDRIDGVVAVDLVLLAELVGVSGPVEVGGTVIEADSAVELLANGQYVRFFGDGGFDRAAQDDRRELLSAVADAVLADLLGALDLDALRTLRDAGQGRHLMVWSADPELQATWADLGVAGELSPDSLLLSSINRSGNKLDWFLRTTAAAEVTEGDVTDEVAVTVRVRNTAPELGQPTYVVGPYPGSGLDAGAYLGVLALTLPADATSGRVDGDPALAVVGSEGPSNRVVGTWIEVPRGSSTDVVFRFEVPAGRSSMTVEPSARITPTRWTLPDGTSVRDDDRRIVRW
ncbi:MAG: DUF4012 domain-containing protein [Actinomycetota bacterium]